MGKGKLSREEPSPPRPSSPENPGEEGDKAGISWSSIMLRILQKPKPFPQNFGEEGAGKLKKV